MTANLSFENDFIPSVRIGELFRNYREKRAYSLAQTAEGAGIESAGLLEEFESGQKHIPLNVIYSLSNFLNVPASEIVDVLYQAYTQFAKPSC